MMRKHLFSTLLAALTVGLSLASCSQDKESTIGTGNGTLSLSLRSNRGFTRALSEADYTQTQDYTVNIADMDGKTVAGPYKGSELPNSIVLPCGSYTISAFYGKEHNASRDEFLSKGEETIYLGSGEEKGVNLTCSPTCGKCVVKFDSEMATYYEDYYVEYTTQALGSSPVKWAKEDSEPWYLLVNKEGEDVTATIHLTPKEAYKTDGEGTVTKTYNLKPNKGWTLNIAPNYTSSTGTLGITITIDESTDDHEENVVIPAEWI